MEIQLKNSRHFIGLAIGVDQTNMKLSVSIYECVEANIYESTGIIQFRAGRQSFYFFYFLRYFVYRDVMGSLSTEAFLIGQIYRKD